MTLRIPGQPLLDTRTKIRPPAAAAPRPGAVIAKGWFDILTAEHCRALADAKTAAADLVVMVLRESAYRATVFDAGDRAQLVAGLGCVDEVVICDESEAEALISNWRPAAAVDVEACVKRDVVADVIAGKRGG